MNAKKLITACAISLIAIGSTACSTPAPMPVAVELSRPARPVLPKIRRDEADKIELMTWIKISERNRLLRQYAEQLETVIDSTRQTK